MVTFELTSSIKPLITTLKLIYGQSLDANAVTLTIPPESIPEGDAPGIITTTQLSQINNTNYQFKLRTVIGLYTLIESIPNTVSIVNWISLAYVD